MECEAARTHLADRLTGELTPEAARALDEHLRACPACAREAVSIAQTWALLADVPAAPADSARMRARLDDALHVRPVVPRWWMAHGLQAAAALVLVALGFLAGRETMRTPAMDPALGELREELRVTRQMVSLSLLQQQSASERLRGITYTSQIEQPGGEIVTALLDTLMHDPDANVRLKSVDALKRFADRENVRRVAAAALTDQASPPLVQIALIDFLVDANDRGAVESLRRLSQDTMVHQAVRARAVRGLQQIRVM
jgi:hypothetical protein